jgi:abequosyltransferase
MEPPMPELPVFKLSFCITTRNRAALIGATLESIIDQATNDCEIVIVDGASSDDTTQIVSQYARRFTHLRYIRQETNNGLDRGFNQAVEHARGEYFWLMPDDDFLKPGAVATVLKALHRDYSLIVVNVEYRNLEMSTVLQDSHLSIVSDCEFTPLDHDQLFATCWKLIRYSGAIVMKREIWLARERERYFGSYWMDVAVVFQERLPGPTLVIATPLISVRAGNQSWVS